VVRALSAGDQGRPFGGGCSRPERRQAPGRNEADEAVVYDFCTELSTNHAVSDATFSRAKETLGQQQLVNLIALSGTYVTVAMLLNAAQEPVPPGKSPPLQPLPAR